MSSETSLRIYVRSVLTELKLDKDLFSRLDKISRAHVAAMRGGADNTVTRTVVAAWTREHEATGDKLTPQQKRDALEFASSTYNRMLTALGGDKLKAGDAMIRQLERRFGTSQKASKK